MELWRRRRSIGSMPTEVNNATSHPLYRRVGHCGLQSLSAVASHGRHGIHYKTLSQYSFQFSRLTFLAMHHLFPLSLQARTVETVLFTLAHRPVPQYMGSSTVLRVGGSVKLEKRMERKSCTPRPPFYLTLGHKSQSSKPS